MSLPKKAWQMTSADVGGGGGIDDDDDEVFQPSVGKGAGLLTDEGDRGQYR